MIKATPHTDLTNPQNWDSHIIKGLTKVEQHELNSLYGKIGQTVWGFNVEILLTQEFVVTDDYGNELYICKYNNKDKAFKLINTPDFQFCHNFDEFDMVIKKFFKRKIKH